MPPVADVEQQEALGVVAAPVAFPDLLPRRIRRRIAIVATDLQQQQRARIRRGKIVAHRHDAAEVLDQRSLRFAQVSTCQARRPCEAIAAQGIRRPVGSCAGNPDTAARSSCKAPTPASCRSPSSAPRGDSIDAPAGPARSIASSRIRTRAEPAAAAAAESPAAYRETCARPARASHAIATRARAPRRSPPADRRSGCRTSRVRPTCRA